jgi:hypothetical protein
MKQPAELPDDQLFLLRIVWETFRISDEDSWPDIDDLQRRLDISGMDHRNVREIAQKIPRNLLHIDRYSWRGPLRLSVEGLTYCNDADALLDLVPRFVTLCVDRYRESSSSPPRASMNRTEVAGRLGLLPVEELRPKRLLRQLYLLMHEESYIYGGGTESAEGNWVFHVDMKNIREFLHVTSLKQYLETVARLDLQFQHEFGPAPATPPSPPSTKAVSPVRSLVAAVSRSIERGAGDAISQATKWIVLAILVILAAGVLAIVGLKAPISLPIFPR